MISGHVWSANPKLCKCAV